MPWLAACKLQSPTFAGIGDGATSYGSGSALFFWSGAPVHVLDQGDCTLPEAELRACHVAAYIPAIEAGCLTVMVSYSSYHGTRLHEHAYLLSEVLKQEIGFDGCVGDPHHLLSNDPACSLCLLLQ